MSEQLWLRQLTWNEILEMILSQPNVYTINLQCNNLGFVGIKALCSTFTFQHVLITLDCSDTNIGPEGIQIIIDWLANTSTLRHLFLACVGMCDNQMITLMQVLHTNPILETLDVGANDIHECGAIGIAHILKTLPRLSYLNLQYNQIKDQGALAIAELIENNPQIQHLNLSGNAIGKEAIHVIQLALQNNHIVQNLYLWYNDKYDEDFDQIQQCLERNRKRFDSYRRLVLVWKFYQNENQVDWNILSHILFPMVF